MTYRSSLPRQKGASTSKKAVRETGHRKPRKKRRFLVLFLLLLLGSGLWLTQPFYAHGFHRLADAYGESLPSVHSTVDKDGDGIDDQTDILQETITYLSTNPRYESRYYPNGYPDDEYGVCTDVVAFSLLHAGYDLKTLVADDVAKHPQDYDIAQPDANIDFRRVRNLKVFFAHYAIPKATDFADIYEWQGGDIVIFEDHIGMVSDRRNAHGIPYVLHNGSPTQRGYEQDILENRQDIVAHYRMSE